MVSYCEKRTAHIGIDIETCRPRVERIPSESEFPGHRGELGSPHPAMSREIGLVMTTPSFTNAVFIDYHIHTGNAAATAISPCCPLGSHYPAPPAPKDFL